MAQKLTPFGKPFARNGDKTGRIFFGRAIYDQYVLENENIGPIDSYETQFYYGRLDLQGDSVFAERNNLRAINYDSNEEILLLAPVAQAASDLFEFYEKTRLKNIRRKGGLLENIKPKFGYDDPFPRYDRYMRALYEAFANAESRNVKNFEGFVKIFLQHLENVGKDMTFSSFVLSKYCHPRMTGLMLEISRENFGDDIKKSDYILDANFEFYYDAALKFGFKIDKNAPWRLIADINSPAMKDYYTRSKDFSEDIFKTYFKKAYEEDLILIEDYMINFYLSYMFDRKRCVSEPMELNYNTLKGKYPEQFWVLLYVDIKEIENS